MHFFYSHVFYGGHVNGGTPSGAAVTRRNAHPAQRASGTIDAMSEPEAASNPADLRTRAAKRDDGWQLDGRKIWISHAGIAAGILVAARKEAALARLAGPMSTF